MFSFKNQTSSPQFPNHNLAEIAIKSGFKFRDIENRKLDWKTLGCVDVNKVIDTQDFDFLQKIIPKIIEAPMQPILGASVLDPAVSSLFRLAQLSLQYLSFCQQFMDFALYDLRSAYSHLQKVRVLSSYFRFDILMFFCFMQKNSSLRQNFKRLEEEHYRALEKIQIIQSSHGIPAGDERISDSNVQISACESITREYQEQQSKLQSELKALKEKMNVAEREIVQISNNNMNFDPTNSSCVACAKRTDISFNSVAIQCDDGKGNGTTNDPEEASINNDSERNAASTEDANEQQTESTVEEVTVIKEADTIASLRAELQELKSSLVDKAKEQPETPKTKSPGLEPKASTETNEKISEIQQKFTDFEAMYAQSQNQFIETFKSLDEQQKNYIHNIQDSIKEIVEKSLVQYGSTLQLNAEPKPLEAKQVGSKPMEAIRKPVEAKPVGNKQTEAKAKPAEAKPVLPVEAKVEIVNSATSAESFSSEYSSTEEGEEDEEEAVIAPVKTKSIPNARSKPPSVVPSKEDVVREFEQRLEQLGVDSNASGLSSPLRCEVNKEIAEERKEIKRAHKSFSATRSKLKAEVEKIAKSKVALASSATSLSEDSKDSSEEEIKRPQRPKSANVFKRREKTVLRKFVGTNDIDENELMGKMKMAQKAIDAHRESIQELLQTATHSPKDTSISEAKTAKLTKTVNYDDNNAAANRYSKMPNVTTRRVVFVNLDEDS